jgi:two-component system, NarL family, invasion response regulator UvrY
VIRLLVVDDHTIFRAGMARLMSDQPDMRVAGEAPDGPSALALLRQGGFDVVLMDINMGPRSGLATLAALRTSWPRLPVIMLSMYAQAQYARLALKAGANAYLSKDVATDELLQAVRQVAGGGLYIPPGFAASAGAAAEPAAPHLALSPREMQVLHEIVCGQPLTAIGERLCVSVKTIGSLRSRILAKLGLASNAELVQYAVRQGLVD